MGADLYLESGWKPLHGPITKKAASPGEFYKAARATGFYYRGDYNVYDVMWAMGLSWWATVLPMLDAAGRLPIARARELVAMIEARPLNKETFGLHYLDVATGAENPITAPLCAAIRASGEPVELPPVPPLAELLSLLQKRREELLALLRKSIDLKEPLICSL